ncbi:uncharacterized protein LOC126788790 [Argentina anserina]|uniref:uncharacterized protein LOC126788790 n=1 Tax=Argentina anserina TaxID=57926 RepID=UPI00217630C7|nr:uncharacterized protein LOC126788790 [Potentilla anserina]
MASVEVVPATTFQETETNPVEVNKTEEPVAAPPALETETTEALKETTLEAEVAAEAVVEQPYAPEPAAEAEAPVAPVEVETKVVAMQGILK